MEMKWRLLSLLASTMILAACSPHRETIKPVDELDLPRFMGDWYVIAHIPTFIERNAYDAIESYELSPDGEVKTTFRYRSGSFDGPLRTLHPVAYVDEGSKNAVWGMEFIWPIRAQYIVAYVDPDYQQTIIARDARDYVWIMARGPSVSPEDYQRLVGKVEQLGYPIENIRRVPQRPNRPSQP